MKHTGKRILVASLLLNTISPLAVSASELNGVITEQTVNYSTAIDTGQLQLSQQTGTIGDTIAFRLPMANQEEIVSSVVSLYNAEEDATQIVQLKLNGETGSLEGSLSVDDQLASGIWQIEYIEVINQNASERVYNDALVDNSELGTTADLSNYDITITEIATDTMTPAVDKDSISVSHGEIKSGQLVKYSVAALDNRQVVLAEMKLYNETIDKMTTIELTYDPVINRFDGEFTPTLTDIGVWEIASISTWDAVENESTMFNSQSVYKNEIENTYDFSQHDLTVLAVKETISPAINSKGLLISGDNVEKGKPVSYIFSASGFTDPDTVKGTLTIQHIETGKNHVLPVKFISVTGHYHAELETTDELATGKWVVSSINLNDKDNNSQHVYNVQIHADKEGAVDLSQADLELTEKVNKIPSVLYSTHIQSIGWQAGKLDGASSGTVNQGLRLEAIIIDLQNTPFTGNVEYQTHIQSIGWQDYVKNGAESGTKNQSKRMEAIRIKLTGEIAENYDIYYRVHAQSYGWLDWAKNGESAGTEGLGKRLEAIEIKLVKKGNVAPGSTHRPFVQNKPIIAYKTHVQSEGWTDYVENGDMSGTSGRGLRLEGIRMRVADPLYSGNISYRTHIQSIGWQDWKNNDTLSGTEGKALRLEAIQIKLDGELAQAYDIYYRVHAQSFGWLDWAKNGESAGTEGLALRLEGIEVVLVKKGGPAPGETNRNFILSDPTVNYTTHVQKQGWQNTVSDGGMSGTSGKGLRLEGILMNVFTQSLTGDIQYRTHVQREGWQDWKKNWQLSGTQGKGLRLEAIEIKLSGEMAKFYDIYYRVHAQSYGWLGWAKNGESAGTAGLAKRLEGIEVKLVRKGAKAPGSTERAFVK